MSHSLVWSQTAGRVDGLEEGRGKVESSGIKLFFNSDEDFDPQSVCNKVRELLIEREIPVGPTRNFRAFPYGL
ncbi:MAG: hypothetical protein HYW48_02845 [Deltaproteobacteria bacterium]|nr:hypothetical protein [Deltaproteobacteria bacterium]